MLFRRHREAAEHSTWGLLLGFAVALMLLVAAVNLALAVALRLTLPIVHGYPRFFFETNTALVLLFVLGGCWIETLRLREGGAHVARLAGARPADTAERGRNGPRERRLLNVVQEIALAARAPPPAVWVLPRDPNINAFAAGWTSQDAVIVVTQGALERLTRAELQGLVGHEMGHLVSGDTRLNTRLIGLVWGLQMVHDFGRTLAARDEQGRVQAGAVIGVALMAVGYLGWLAGRLLQAGVARQREFGADASAVQYARTVDGIGGVLRKIAGLPPMARPSSPDSLAHLWMAEAAGAGLFGWRRWLATHPPIALRLQRLYGRDVGVLDAPLLPPPSPTEEPLMAFAPAQPVAPSGRAASAPRLDAFASAAMASDVQDERDALQRASHWRSRGECHAALLAWLIADDGAQAPWPAWRALVGDQPYVEQLRSDWLVLEAHSRWRVFDALITRARQGPPADRAALVRAARGLGAQGAARLRRTLLVRRLRSRPDLHGALPLEALTGACAHATGLLAQAMGAQAAHWASELGAASAAAPRRAFSLRRLHAMQRPRVARAWVDAAVRCALLRDQPAALGLLVAACRLLDTPPPPALLQDRSRIV
ncbi:MAG: M48 family metalloprotease [Rubrivivax sp.]